MLESHLAGKATEKRQNFNPSTHLHRTSPLHVEQRNQEVPGPLPDTHAQMAWEDTDHKVS
jgi:hypothetical protein